MYKRKTQDEWQIHIAYKAYNSKGYEWEEVSAYDNRKEAIENKKSYLLNDKELIDIRITKKRIKKEN